jgi:hypothetical protein
VLEDPRTPEEFFDGSPEGHAVYDVVCRALAGCQPLSTRVTRSQLAFRADRGFAWLWRPDRYVRSAWPVVLSLALPEPVDSQRFKEVLQPAPGRWMHHLELAGPEGVDAEVEGWLRAAHAAATRG